MNYSRLSLAVFTALVMTPQVLAADAERSEDKEQAIERITVTGDFRARGIEDLPASVSVLRADDLRQRNAEHLEQALAMAANVNLASGASRASFLQIRGVGERSQFADTVTPSVGILIDGINYSGMGSAATLFDIGRVEVFRGPQSTRFGADGMAGVLYLTSEAIPDYTEGLVELLWANYNTYGTGVAVGHRFSETFAGRASIYQYNSDGFIENIHLDRKDTQNHDELTVRLNGLWQPSDAWAVALTYHRFDIDNGYDAWSLDLNRQTLSDTPGSDTLDSHAGRVAATYAGADAYTLELSASVLTAKSEYSYDEDWAFEGIRPGWEYNSEDKYFRDRDQVELEARWLSAQPIQFLGQSTDWLFGLYWQDRQQDLLREYTYLNAPFTSRYDTQNQAAYGELSQQWTERLRATAGLRYERYENDYADSRGITAEPSTGAWGGRASLEYRLQPNQTVYASIARGFKSGGVNGEALGRVEDRNLEEFRDFLEERAVFEPEFLTSLETGYHAFFPEHSLRLHVNAFYSWRDDMQVNAYVERDAIFVTYRDNASSGRNYGMEASIEHVPSDRLRWFASLGLLRSKFDDLLLQDGTNLRGRNQAHAPEYQAHVGFEYLVLPNLEFRAEVDARDAFYYSNTHDERSESYQLMHMRLNYYWQQWEFSLFARNLLDEDFTTRGFYFGNDPRDEYTPKNYVQYGEPRRIGLNARFRF
ncbi:MAG: TonB-dependent receptor [Idiomarina sp.]|nr:TonB-dependent receptor [Idiomarina sp.]